MKIALVSSWLWMDGAYFGRLERVDYVRLLTRVRERRAAAADGREATTLELEVDALSDWQNAHHLLGLCDGFERVELSTPVGRFSLRIDTQLEEARPASSNESRTVLFVSSDEISVWAGEVAGASSAIAPEGKPQKLLQVSGSRLHDELEAGLRLVCSNGSRCAPFVVYFDERLQGRELVRVLESLQRFSAGRATPAVISLALRMPPPLGEEAEAFVQREPGSGRLPLIVIRQVVRSSYGALLTCFEGGLARHPKLAGLVIVRFIIERDGSVSNVADSGSDLPDGDVTQCVIQRFRSLRFPTPNAGVVTVHYPILLRPS